MTATLPISLFPFTLSPAHRFRGAFSAFSAEKEERLLGASDYHAPVLPAETREAFSPAPRVILDATAGGGGHSELLLKEGHRVIALDRDLDSLKETASRLGAYKERFTSVHSNFSDLDSALESLGISQVDGILADFGVSSHQLDQAPRGFSFRHEGPLDMRMDQNQSLSARDIIQTYAEDDLKRIFREYGEERHAGKIARRITEARETQTFSTTTELAEFILKTIGKREKIHPATRVFQALRMEVNDELGEIRTLLEKAPALLKSGGRLALISFHSLEDRIVKRFIAHHSAETIDRKEWPAPRPNPDYCLKNLTKKPQMALPEEVQGNPRARTAKLRIAEKI